MKWDHCAVRVLLFFRLILLRILPTPCNYECSEWCNEHLLVMEYFCLEILLLWNVWIVSRPLLPCNAGLYLSCVSPALTLILPKVRSGFLFWPPQGMMVCTRFHMLFHRADPSQRIVSNIKSPKSLSRVIKKVKVLLPKIVSVLFKKTDTKTEQN